GSQTPDHLLTFGRAEINYQRALAAIAGMKIGSILLRSCRGGDKWRAPLARVISLRRLNFDDVRPEVGEYLAGPWTRQDPGELQNADAGQGRARILRSLTHGWTSVAKTIPRSLRVILPDARQARRQTLPRWRIQARSVRWEVSEH